MSEFGHVASAHLSPGFFSSFGAFIPLSKDFPADTETPVSLYLKLASYPYSYLLESVEGGEVLGRYSFIGFDPILIFRCAGSQAEIFFRGKRFAADRPLDLLRELAGHLKAMDCPPDMPRFFGGLVGYFSYDFSRYLEKIPDLGKPALDLPEVYLVLNRVVVIYDHLTRQARIVVLRQAGDKGDEERAHEVIVEVYRRLTKSDLAVPPEGFNISPELGFPELSMSRKEFLAKVGEIKRHIAAGDCIQVVLSQRLTVPFAGHPFDVYRRLRQINPSPYLFYLNFPEVQLAGSSPEMLVRVEDGLITTRPIAGTRKRGLTRNEDITLAEELQKDEKERAEHLMLLDLGRNDVGKTAFPGTVKISRLMEVERYSHVMHLVSEVTGGLPEDKTSLEAFLACFPAGTVAGAPKIRAMQIIEELETVKRGPYAGAVGYLGLNGNLDTCIAIRTVIFTKGKAVIQAGAGIVADSVPEKEYQEVMAKAEASLQALGLKGGGLNDLDD